MLFVDDQYVALRDGLTLLAADLGDLARVLRLHRHLHLHGLEDRHGFALLHLVADSDLDLPDCAGDVRLDVGHGGRGQYPALMPEPGRVVIVTARPDSVPADDPGDRPGDHGDHLYRLRRRGPAARAGLQRVRAVLPEA